MSYQEAFPNTTEFMVMPVVDRQGLTKDNWYLSEFGINRVMCEIQKICKYFGAFIPNWVK